MRFDPHAAYLTWAVPLGAAILVGSVFIAPNYLRASALREEQRMLDEATEEYLAERAALEGLSVEVASMRDEVSRTCQSMPESPDRSGMVAGISRPVDGESIHDQQIRVGSLEDHQVNGTGPARKRSVTVEMVGSFDALFEVIEGVDDSPSMARFSEIDLRRAETPGAVDAKLTIDEYFQAGGTR